VHEAATKEKDQSAVMHVTPQEAERIQVGVVLGVVAWTATIECD
jgi:hypothetical protein